jgi:hypothetical protein
LQHSKTHPLLPCKLGSRRGPQRGTLSTHTSTHSILLHFSRYTVRFLMRAGFEGLSSWWQQGIGSGHSTWAFSPREAPHACTV